MSESCWTPSSGLTTSPGRGTSLSTSSRSVNYIHWFIIDFNYIWRQLNQFFSCWKKLLHQGHKNRWEYLRLRFLDLSRSTFETCQDFLDCQDTIFFVSVKIFKIETFESRFNCAEIFVKIFLTVKTYFSRQIETPRLKNISFKSLR
jgi:hypothetical protein